MTRDELLSKVRDGEDNFVERKPAAVKSKDIARTLVAFVNSLPANREAVLFIGVRDNGEIENCPNTDTLQKTIGEICSQDCYPPITHQCEILMVDERLVVAVVVRASQNRPHFAGPAYVRLGSRSVKASPEQFDELVLHRTSKVAALAKMKNSLVTVQCLRHKLGDAKTITGAAYRNEVDCTVKDVDAHNLRLQMVASSEMVSEPLESVTITYDEKRYRPMLIVRGL